MPLLTGGGAPGQAGSSSASEDAGRAELLNSVAKFHSQVRCGDDKATLCHANPSPARPLAQS